MDMCRHCGEGIEQRGSVWVHVGTWNTYCHDDDGPEEADDFASYSAPEAAR